LAGLTTDRALFHRAPQTANPYHARVRLVAAASTIKELGTWIGTDCPLPPAAVALLKPNVAVSRQYQDSITGRRVTFLLVQCSDARDLLGHYPPVCYVRQGWTLRDARPQDWLVDALQVRGMHYEFTSGRIERPELVTVLNFMVLPQGTVCRDMEGVTLSAQHPGKKFFGAAQVQLVCDGAIAGAESEELVKLFVGAYRPLLDAVMSGIQDE
jgi:hypothetical protein